MKISIKWLLGVLGAAIIGNAMWEYFARDALNWCFGKAAVAFNSVNGSYLDLLHERIGFARPFDSASFIADAAIVSACCGSIAFVLLGGTNLLFTSQTSPSTKSKIKFSVVAALIFLALMSTEKLYRFGYAAQAVLWVERSLEILRPKISDAEFFQLRADYRSVDNAGKFYDLHSSLVHIGETHKIKLPDFKPIGS